MGTDRFKFVDVECPCGAGRITITSCSPDHAYAKPHQKWEEREIGCESCAKRFDFRNTRTGNIWLFNRRSKKRVQLLHDEVKAKKQFAESLKNLGRRS